MEKIEVILTECVKEIRTGKSTLTECLERYPSQRQVLEPLLRIALNIQEPPAFNLDPAYKHSAKAQLLQQIRARKPVKSRSWIDIFSFGLPRQLVWARVAVMAVIGVIIISLMGGSTAYAAQSSLPGEVLYPVKKGTEEVRLWAAGDNADKAELNMAFARVRLDELNRLASRNSSQTELAVQGYRNNLRAAESNLQSITNAATRVNMLERFSQKLGDQISYCDLLVEATYGENLSIRQATDLAVTQQIDTFTNLAQQDNLLAAQANLDMMQNRLQRAQAKAIEQQYQIMQSVLFQYQQFSELGQRMLQNTHNTQNQTAEIDNLTATRLQSYLETLSTISQQVPQGYQSEVEASQAMTIQYHNQARYGHQTRGESEGEPGQTQGYGPGPGPNLTPSNDGSNTTPEPTSSAIYPTPSPGNGEGSGGSGGSGPGPGSSGGTGTGGDPNSNSDNISGSTDGSGKH
ncbi:MAG: DUF5667 domain-containing protein [Dehalococcoidales bacterium]|nr:DUF5667 domain-containing protein [Dehalococcoidales bacterium]